LPVTAGRRAVLVAELWHGPERDCAHRCTKRVGACGVTREVSHYGLERGFYHNH
jgi:hypothetical protein